ncbi:SDR family oxidoreductase [Bailinhaonella thermotolerans]|uniref:SDR family oxidoreductase n=1 Tax=Bailinhaonella thermotolerans TaxID=1070861 RepID=A0A3A4B2Y1_9ACTN|nr:SDR family oxidoreductase [Bailinhaonella thermotolerans]RJL36075.1 SDR family oxidoreductase [Bailinhaonella thermotolerans]
MDLGLTDRVFVITGGSRGLGLATARALVSAGARVVVSSRDPEAVERAAGDLGPAAVGVAADNADEDAGERLVTAARDSFGRLDGALISVGGPPAASIGDTTEDQWRAAFETIFLGSVRLARAFAGALGEGGSLAFVLSSSVRSPIPGLAVSNGLRPGLAGFAKNLSDELGPRGVRVNALLPGRIATDRVRELDSRSGDPDEVRDRLSQAIPLRRYGTPEEFGRVAAFLLSPAASYLTGVMLPVDGGAQRVI